MGMSTIAALEEVRPPHSPMEMKHLKHFCLVPLVLLLLLLQCVRVTSLSGMSFVHMQRMSQAKKQSAFVRFATKQQNAIGEPTYGGLTNTTEARDSNLDAMRARAGVLRTSILKQQRELQQLERQIICCSQPSSDGLLDHPIQTIARTANQTFSTFIASTNVLIRKLGRVHGKIGPSNRQWNSVGDYVAAQTATGARIVGGLVQRPDRLLHLVDPDTATLVPHVPAILARLDKLESHVEPILERVLNNRRHLASIEPYLDEILDRFDDIEPHLPWILENIDVLAPYTGLLLKHIDELLLYADADDDENDYVLAEQLLPYLEYYVSRLDVVGPHLPLLRPHVPKLLKHNRIARVSPHIDRLFARGYEDLGASANMDVLLFWFGWALRVPGLPRLFFALPGSPRMVTFLANRLPKRFVRGYCSGISCYVDGDYGGSWNKLSSRNQLEDSTETVAEAKKEALRLDILSKLLM